MRIVPTSSTVQAYRVRSCIPLQGEEAATGKALLAPLSQVDDMLLLVQAGRIVHAQKYTAKDVPVGVRVEDLGEETLVPAVVNAHTHMQLSFVAGKTLWGQGFVPWLQSLIPLLPKTAQAFETEQVRTAIDTALLSLKESGTALFADFSGGAMHMVAQAAQQAQVETLLLAEWFGFWEDFAMDNPIPERSQHAYATVPLSMRQQCIPCGHALYSTSATTLQGVKAWCEQHQQPFVLHLAEFPEEEQALVYGTGALVDVYAPHVYPKGWQAPGKAPVEYAAHLGLLNAQTLAVHGVHCTKQDIQLLCEKQVNVCLCPRSNKHLNVGTAPFWDFVQGGIPLCLGTDGLSSNTDVDVWQEALFLRTEHDFPWEALLRMLTVNGVKALGFHRKKQKWGRLEKGAQAKWSFLPKGNID